MCEFFTSILNWNALAAVGTLAAAWATFQAAREAKRAAQISEKVAQDSEKNTQLEIFLKFSEEYDLIKAKFTPAFLNFDSGSNGLSAENTRACLDTLKLFEKEYFLWRKKMIQDQTWSEIFEPKVLKFIKSNATLYVWEQRTKFKTYDFGDAFEVYVKEKMKA